MQDEINSQIVALSIRTGKETARITTRVLQAAIRKYLQDHKQRNPTLTHGKQTVGQLMEQNSQLTNIEVTDQNINVPFPVSWTVKMKKKQKETQDILSYHTQAAGCSDKARAKASGGRQPIEECGRTGL